MRVVLVAVAALIAALPALSQSSVCIDDYRHLLSPSDGSARITAPRLSDIRAGRVQFDATGRAVPAFLKPRLPTARPSAEGLARQPAEFVKILVKLKDDTLASAADGRLELLSSPEASSLMATLDQFPEFRFSRAHSAPEDWLTALRYCAARNTNADHADLTSFFAAPIASDQRASALMLLRALLENPLVETAWLRARPALPAADIPPTTPAFDMQQIYLDAAPNGIGLRNSWNEYSGLLGNGLRYTDVEYSATLDHEDFPAVGNFLNPDPTPPGHGTAVLGVLSAANNTYGVHGGVPNAAASIMNDWENLGSAFGQSIFPGDALVIELAYTVDPKGTCTTSGFNAAVPLERDDDIYWQIRSLTSNGVVVFQPAGNEGLNLDAPCWGGELSRGGRDSGAVLVGARNIGNCGANPIILSEAAPGSSHGSRLDANGWGFCVTTTGYNGDIFNPNNDARQRYTETFNGTSSATPIVTAAGMALQSWQKNRTGYFYSGVQIRALLQRFGTSMTSGNYIAKQPDVLAALQWLNGDDDGDSIVNGDELAAGTLPVRAADLNGDTKSDILYRNYSSGAINRLLMTGLTISGQDAVYTEPNMSWTIIGNGDFDGDGISDVLWRNSSTGQVAIQFFNVNGFPAPVVPIAYTEPNPAWKVVHTPDLNGDGKADLLWWNSSTGQVWAVLMNGSSIIQQGSVMTEPDTNWRIVAVARLSALNRENFLIWRHSGTGMVWASEVLWAGFGFSQIGHFVYQEPNLSWKLIAAADVNNDSRYDLIWRNEATGQIWLMLMSGTTISAQGQLYQEPNLAWKVVASGDYNGDGRSDLLWRNESTGEVYMMLLDGISIASQGFVYSEPNLNWRILGFWEYGIANGNFP